MIRQAHTYLVGAMGGASLIAVAIAVFVVLVSAQVVKDWPFAGLGGGGEDAAVSEARPAASGAGAATGVRAGAAAGADGNGRAGDGANRAGSTVSGGGIAANDGSAGNATEPGAAGGGGQGGSPAGSPQATNTGGSAGGGAASSGNGSAGGGGKSGGGGGGGSTSSPSGQVTSTVNDTVNQVDEAALGGTLGKTGVTEATEGIVNGVAGPESVVGQVVDEAVGAVGGILGQKP
jgi:hypothetical protein